MESASLKQLLKNLCTNSQWSYALFWKLQQLDDYKVLSCEDVYCDSEKSQNPCQKIFIDPLLYSSKEDIPSFGFETNLYDDVHSLGYSTGSAVYDISCCQYLLGEGVVGRAALAESDFWIYTDDNESTELISNFGYGDEWVRPITAGIKTTLLAPLLPYGVLQMGSMEKVAESLAVCADIRDRFLALTYRSIIPLPNYGDDSLFSSSTLVPEPENNDDELFSCNNLQIMEYEDASMFHYAEFVENNSSAAYDQRVPFMDGNHLELEDISFLVDEQNMIHPYLHTNVEFSTASELVIADIPVATEMWMVSCHEGGFDEARVSGDSSGEEYSDFVPKQVMYPHAAESRGSHINSRDCDMGIEATETLMFSCHEAGYDDAGVTGDSSAEINSASFTKHEKYLHAAGFGACYTDSIKLDDFPRACELQEVLWPVFKTNDDSHSRYLYKENVYSHEGFDFAAMETCGPFEEGGEQEQLLEDVVATCTNSDDTLFYRCSSTSKSSVASLSETAPDDTCSAQEECNTTSDYQSALAKSMTPVPSLDSLESVIIEDEERQLERASELLNRNAKKPKNNRAREKPKSNAKPRPRDRQLIQDRLKLLRNLVPDSAKCSIDGLLDQTAKHMLFLRSVTERAERVKHLLNQEVETNKERKNTRSGNNIEACPIIVKDTEHPNQFLIQMVCTDEGVFFEIAEVMHKLKLTILKGTVENGRNQWASFIVEASKGFNRLDIFWPLMRILQQHGNWMADQLCP